MRQGAAPQGRPRITILKNNGLSVQFAGVGAAVIRRAREHGLGRELPSYLFETAFAHSPPPLTNAAEVIQESFDS